MNVETGAGPLVSPEVLLSLALAAAYIGPGAGLASIGSLLAFGGAILVMLVGFVWWPVLRARRAWRAWRAKRRPDDAPSAEGDAAR